MDTVTSFETLKYKKYKVHYDVEESEEQKEDRNKEIKLILTIGIFKKRLTVIKMDMTMEYLEKEAYQFLREYGGPKKTIYLEDERRTILHNDLSIVLSLRHRMEMTVNIIDNKHKHSFNPFYFC